MDFRQLGSPAFDPVKYICENFQPVGEPTVSQVRFYAKDLKAAHGIFYFGRLFCGPNAKHFLIENGSGGTLNIRCEILSQSDFLFNSTKADDNSFFVFQGVQINFNQKAPDRLYSAD